MADYMKHFEIYDRIYRILTPGYDPGPGPGDGTLGGIGKAIVDVIVGDEYAAVWDTGNGDVDLRGYIEQYITDKPLICFNSHGHPDHSRGNRQFAEVWIGEEDIPMATKLNELDTPMKGHEFCEVVKMGTECKYMPVEEGQVFDLGGRTLTIHKLPGHSEGCITAIDSKCRVLFSGDTILKRIGISGATRQQYKERLLKIRELDFDIILGGHWDMPMDKEQIDRFIRICDEFTPEKAMKSVNTLGGQISTTYQYFLENDFANPEFASISMRDPEFFYGKEED